MSYVLRRISTGEIIRRNVLDGDAETVVGLDPDLEFLKVVQQTQPDYDPRYFVLTSSEGKVGTEWRQTWGTQKRPVAEIEQAVENHERLLISEQVPAEDLTKLIVLALAALFREVKGLQLTPSEATTAGQIVALGRDLALLDEKAKLYKAEVRAGREPDLDAPWLGV